MPEMKARGIRMLWILVRGTILGASLAAVLPTEPVLAACDCHDYGSGGYQCLGDTACSAGSETCDVTCKEI